MAKRSGGMNLSSLPAAVLHRELRRRQGRVSALVRRRDRLVAKLDKLDAQIREMGGAAGGRRGGSGTGMGAATRASNSAGLADSLAKVLSGKTMGVTEASEAVQKAGYKTNAANFRTIVNACLLKNKNMFKKVSRGQYTAA